VDYGGAMVPEGCLERRARNRNRKGIPRESEI
jgi:hypothetical protein